MYAFARQPATAAQRTAGYANGPETVEIENPFETAEVLDDDDDDNEAGTVSSLENPFECSELEYSESDSESEDRRPLAYTRQRPPPIPPTSRKAGSGNWTPQRPRAQSHTPLSGVFRDASNIQRSGSSSTSSSGGGHGSLAPPLPSRVPRRMSADTASVEHYVASMLAYAEKQNSIDRVQMWSGTVSAHTLAAMDEQERKRQETIFEVITTEYIFLRNMFTVAEVFREPLRKALKGDEADHIFLNLDEILNYSARLLSDLLQRQNRDQRVIKSIGDIFAQHISDMQCFSSYCARQATAARRLQQHRSRNPRIVAILQEARQNPRSRKMDISSLLIEPMQRITRYKLLLKQILKLTPAHHEDVALLKQALEGTEKLLVETNESTRILDNLERLHEIESWVDLSTLGKHYDLAGQTMFFEQRYILMDGELVKANSGRKLQAYLFTDMLLLTQPPKYRSTSGYKNSIYREPMLLNELQLRVEPTSRKASAEACFQIVYGQQTITLKAPNIGSKTKWTKEIAQAQESFREAKERLDGAPPPDSEVIGRLQVLVCEAGALVNPDPYAFRTTVDAYCVITVCGQQKRTQVIGDSNNPRWQETFRFPVDDMREVARIDVYHQSTKYCQPEFLGSAEVLLATLDEYGGKSSKTTLRLINTQRRGTVTLHLTFNPR